MFNIFQVKLLAQRFSTISAQETAAKAKEEHGEEQKPTQVRVLLLPFINQRKSHLALSLKYLNNS